MAARRKHGSTASGGSRWWWLAIPALGIAAYAAFDATLSLVSDDREREPAVLDAGRAVRPNAVPAGDAVAPSSVDGVPVATLAEPAPAQSIGADAVAPAGSGAPVPTVTPVTQRAAADKKAVKRKPAPKEDIRDSDRRALEDVLERATRQGTR